ncbi:MAG: HAMP domain-containing histidine kinase, partial [Candidatus Hydrogenedentes bacterium]|nr:HAMP domain-containing histidine kinase [Candidatus Hydrogenedentota bacterium]
GELSSSVVHEMRNPLSSIKMNLQALRRKTQGDPDYEELAEIAAAQAQRVETMLDDLLQYGRPVELNPQPTSFRELTEPALAVVADKAREKNVRVELKDELGNARLSVDREQMCRAMTNLLANAIQAVAPGQTVYVIGTRRNDAGPAHAQLEVRDTGPGLSPEALDRAFKPFFTSKPNGTGLGLANVKKIIELHRGAVSASNRPEGGAAITLLIPLEGNV